MVQRRPEETGVDDGVYDSVYDGDLSPALLAAQYDVDRAPFD